MSNRAKIIAATLLGLCFIADAYVNGAYADKLAEERCTICDFEPMTIDAKVVHKTAKVKTNWTKQINAALGRLGKLAGKKAPEDLEYTASAPQPKIERVVPGMTIAHK